ncbi:ACP S-malonyltransferase [Egibacter rhizosphaerae]|nr:ACP S-malonyltransferase [Egibacter rhizosphaerae]
MTGSFALVFPGQGSQRPGMAEAWRGEAGSERWTEAGDVLGWDVARLGFDADADELREPASCQIALFVHGAALLDAWRAAGGPEPVAVAGHSLGEYNALLTADVLSFADALRLVDVRARATQDAARRAPGTMVACLGFEVATVEEACAEAGAYVANDNAPGQIVAAGGEEALARLRERLAEADPRGKVRDVEVGAAYHSPHVEAAVPVLREALDATTFRDAHLPVIANVDAAPHTAAGDWPSLLADQVRRPVRWRETVPALAAQAAGAVVELGASAVLTGLVKRTDRSLERHVVTTPQERDAVLQEVAA